MQNPIQEPPAAAKRRTRARQPSGKSNPAHMAWVRTMACCVPSCLAMERQAHHVRTGTGGGTAMKPDDRWTVPLCAEHHGEGHQIGWKTFEERHGLDLLDMAQQCQRLSPVLTGRPEPG